MTHTNTSSTLLGVNLPWFFGAYGHDLASNERLPTWGCDFNTLKSYRPILEARELGFDAIRIWLCENGEGVRSKDGQIVGVSPKMIEHVKIIQECAALAGVRIYWSFLDANSCFREDDSLTYSILSDRDQCARFAEHVAAPLARLFDPRISFAVEVLNEPESLTEECTSTHKVRALSWETLGRGIRVIGDAIRGERRETLVTAGSVHVFLPKLWRAESGINAIDIHMYHLTGGLPSRSELATQVGDPAILDAALPLFAGECGIPEDAPLEARADLVNYLQNAQSLNYDAAFLWRLERFLIDTDSETRRKTAVGLQVKAFLSERASAAL